MALQDLERGNGFALIDPHGDLVERIADAVPTASRADVIYLNAADPGAAIRIQSPAPRARRIASRSPPPGSWKCSRRCGRRPGACAWSTSCATCSWRSLSNPHATMHDVLRMISDTSIRKAIAASLQERDRPDVPAEGVRAILVRLPRRRHRADPKQGRRISWPIPCSTASSRRHEQDLHIRQIMDEGKVLLVNLAKGRIGEDSSSLLGGLLVTTIGLAGVQPRRHASDRAARLLRLRRRVPELHDARAGQHALGAAQVPAWASRSPTNICISSNPTSGTPCFGNAGTIISFRVGAEDAPYLAREFSRRVRRDSTSCSSPTTTST